MQNQSQYKYFGLSPDPWTYDQRQFMLLGGNMLISWIHQKLEKQILISFKSKLGITALIIAFAIEFRFYLRPINLNFLLLIFELFVANI